ncbi:protein SMAX1-LIKE 4-like [Zingiber officinale]|uniref:Clp R domain-containing protein n=1 Tax=Zingiber officinale TaxID=94328 RepID=A0A8J5GQY8_ZINOF|nr:protein SMAX1-LIKE 4-like [Zingiber officinale]KAG6508260.1 hypothetical protein ZIOFF_033634 [Zingiber officinale]
MLCIKLGHHYTSPTITTPCSNANSPPSQYNSTRRPIEEQQELVFMRTGVCAVHQALTAEVASVLKHSLDLATRRGHAQVTPLHVAATLISSSSASSNLLRRACLKSQPHRPAFHHPLHCRALELCFNVALNRLPTATSPSSGTLLPSPSSLSNSLIAAIKRAQANQRRGCIELEQQQQQQQQLQQPVLTIKVGMEQLMLSILDDPSVSRVMKEAGFSSRCVKSHLEEEASALSQSSLFLLDTAKDFINRDFKPSLSEDLRVVIEVMLRQQGRRTNTLVVGDSGSLLEGLVAELMRRLGRSEIPAELRHASFINLQFSCSHLRLMHEDDVDAKVSDLRRTINSLASHRNGIIIYAGDLRWAVDEEARDGGELSFNPVEHMIAKMGKLLSEFNSSTENRVWLLATASYSTYRKCQIRQPSLDTLWALQAVVVPSGWLGLGLQASSGIDTRLSNFGQFPIELLESRILSSKEEENLICCDECKLNLEKEASVFRSETPCWLQVNSEGNHKEALQELRRKWNKLCESLHSKNSHLCSPFFNQSVTHKSYTRSLSHTWWPSKDFVKPHSVSISTPIYKLNKRSPTMNSSEASFNSLTMSTNQQNKITVALSSPLFSDSATSKDQTRLPMADPTNLQHQLQEEIPWQSNNIPLIMEALHDCISGVKKVVSLLIQGSDHIAKRRLALVMARSIFGSTDRLIHIKQNDSCCETIMDAIRKAQKCIILVEDMDRMSDNFVKSFTDSLKGSLKATQGDEEASITNVIFILTTSQVTKFKNANNIKSVVMMKLCADDASSFGDAKRKIENDLGSRSKRLRKEEQVFDLNFEPYYDIEEVHAVPSDLTQETECISFHLPQELLKSTVQLTLNAGTGQHQEFKFNLLTKLDRAFKEVQHGKDRKGQLFVDQGVTEELMQASAFFLESFFAKWVREVFQVSLQTVQEGGSLRLSLEGKETDIEAFGFMASELPNRIKCGCK